MFTRLCYLLPINIRKRTLLAQTCPSPRISPIASLFQIIWFIAGRDKGTVRVWNCEHCRSNRAIGLHEMKHGSTPGRDFNYFPPSDPVAPYLFSHPIWYRGAWAKAIRSLVIAKHEPAPAEELGAGRAHKSFPSMLQCASAAGGSSQCRKAADFRAAKAGSCAGVVFPRVRACAL